MERLYKFIEDYLPSTYEISYQGMDENKPGVIGIFLYQGQADTKSLDGYCTSEDIKAHIELNCDDKLGGTIGAMNALRKFAITIEDAVSNIDGLEVLFIKILNKAIPTGKNEHGIQKVVSNLEIKYTLEVD